MKIRKLKIRLIFLRAIEIMYQKLFLRLGVVKTWINGMMQNSVIFRIAVISVDLCLSYNLMTMAMVMYQTWSIQMAIWVASPMELDIFLRLKEFAVIIWTATDSLCFIIVKKIFVWQITWRRISIPPRTPKAIIEHVLWKPSCGYPLSGKDIKLIRKKLFTICKIWKPVGQKGQGSTLVEFQCSKPTLGCWYLKQLRLKQRQGSGKLLRRESRKTFSLWQIFSLGSCFLGQIWICRKLIKWTTRKTRWDKCRYSLALSSKTIGLKYIINNQNDVFRIYRWKARFHLPIFSAKGSG